MLLPTLKLRSLATSGVQEVLVTFPVNVVAVIYAAALCILILYPSLAHLKSGQ